MGLEPFYVFLDIDGVLNDEKYIVKCWNKNGNKAMYMNHVPFDPKCLNNLMKLCFYIEKFNYEPKIILTSTWRLHDVDYEIVDARLAEYGLHLSGKTKCINHNRGKEIADYIKISSHNCYMFLILDDESFDIKSYFPHQLIQTDFKTGFNRKCLNKAKEYIRRKLLWSLKNQEL